MFVLDDYREFLLNMLAKIVEQQGVFSRVPVGDIFELCSQIEEDKGVKDYSLHRHVSNYLNRDLLTRDRVDIRESPAWWRIGEKVVLLSGVNRGSFSGPDFQPDPMQILQMLDDTVDMLGGRFQCEVFSSGKRAELIGNLNESRFSLEADLVVTFDGLTLFSCALRVRDREGQLVADLILENAFLQGGAVIDNAEKFERELNKRTEWVLACGEYFSDLNQNCSGRGVSRFKSA